jgi:hypothetical protein
MGRNFTVRSLAANELSQAFPLVQAVAPEVTLDGWLQYADAVFAKGQSELGGIMSAYGQDGYIYGLFSFKIEHDLRYGRVLAVSNLVVLDLVDRHGARQALIGAIDRLAQQHVCDHSYVTVPHRGGAVAGADIAMMDCLRLAGLEVSSLSLSKRMQRNG